MAITKKQLREALQLEVHKALFLREFAQYTATRSLMIKAQQAALDFEKDIVKELDLVNPDTMDEISQQVYHQATEKMAKLVTNAVVDCVKSLEGLPKNQETANEEQQVAANAPQVSF